MTALSDDRWGRNYCRFLLDRRRPRSSTRQLASRVVPYGNQAQLTAFLGGLAGWSGGREWRGMHCSCSRRFGLGWATRPAAARRHPAITGSSPTMLLRPTAPCWISAPTSEAVRTLQLSLVPRFLLEAAPDSYLAWRVMTSLRSWRSALLVAPLASVALHCKCQHRPSRPAYKAPRRLKAG